MGLGNKINRNKDLILVLSNIHKFGQTKENMIALKGIALYEENVNALSELVRNYPEQLNDSMVQGLIKIKLAQNSNADNDYLKASVFYAQNKEAIDNSKELKNLNTLKRDLGKVLKDEDFFAKAHGSDNFKFKNTYGAFKILWAEEDKINKKIKEEEKSLSKNEVVSEYKKLMKTASDSYKYQKSNSGYDKEIDFMKSFIIDSQSGNFSYFAYSNLSFPKMYLKMGALEAKYYMNKCLEISDSQIDEVSAKNNIDDLTKYNFTENGLKNIKLATSDCCDNENLVME